MSICTAAEAVTAMNFWVGYCEKANATAQYLVKDKSVFTANAGSNNYTYMGKLFGCNGGDGAAWCAMTVTEAIYSACGSSSKDAKTVLHGVYPYFACHQVYDAAPSAYKGRRGSWTPIPGDVIVFVQNSKRVHTGMVYAADSSTVYTIEGNVSNKCVKKSYALSDGYIYGYIRPKYKDSGGASSGVSTVKAAVSCTVKAQIVEPGRKADIGYIKSVQALLNTKTNASLTVDGELGEKTIAAVKAFQTARGLSQDGSCGPDTWCALMKI